MKIYALSPECKNTINSFSRRNNLNFASYNVNFRGRDLLELPKSDVFQRINSSLNYENFLGQGVEAEVYRIKDTDYCVRIPYNTNEKMYMSDYSKSLTPMDRINHIVAKLGFGTSIMKFFPGHTPKENMDNAYYRDIFQSRIANMPLKSYTELLHQIAEGINNDMIYDFSGGNLIVDFDNNKLTAIDFGEIKEDSRGIRPLSEIYHVLTCYGSKKETGKKIFDKVVQTGLEEFKPGKIPCIDVELFDFIDLALTHDSQNMYQHRNRFGNIKQSDKLIHSVADCFEELKQLRSEEHTSELQSR